MEQPKDTINHQTRTRPKFKNRVKILFGATIIVDSEIHVDAVVTPIYSTARDSFEFESKIKEL